MNTPVTSISNAALRAEVARQRDARRRAEQAEVDAAHREARALGRNREVAHRHQLAAGRGRDARARARSPAPAAAARQHHARCMREQALVLGQRRRGAHLLQVVAGAEGLAGAGEHDDAHRSSSATLRARSARHRARLGQRVERLGRFNVSVTTPRASTRFSTSRFEDLAERSYSSLSGRTWALMRRATLPARAARNFWISPVKVLGSPRSGSRAAPCSPRAGPGSGRSGLPA